MVKGLLTGENKSKFISWYAEKYLKNNNMDYVKDRVDAFVSSAFIYRHGRLKEYYKEVHDLIFQHQFNRGTEEFFVMCNAETYAGPSDSYEDSFDNSYVKANKQVNKNLCKH